MGEQPDMLPEPNPRDAASLIGADLGDVPDAKWAKALVEFVEVGKASLIRDGLDEDAAFKQACAVVMALAEYRGGRLFYLPRGERLRLALRDMEIHHRWQRGGPTGQIEALADHYGLSTIHVYRVLREQRRMHVRKTQRELPLKGE